MTEVIVVPEQVLQLWGQDHRVVRRPGADEASVTGPGYTVYAATRSAQPPGLVFDVVCKHGDKTREVPHLAAWGSTGLRVLDDEEYARRGAVDLPDTLVAVVRQLDDAGRGAAARSLLVDPGPPAAVRDAAVSAADLMAAADAADGGVPDPEAP